MKYVVMCDGKMQRWDLKHENPKHLVKINGESLIERITRQIHEIDDRAEIIITSHDKRYDVDGAKRYEPQNNKSEIDRFTYELITDSVCFLYGDTYYTDETIKKIYEAPSNGIRFFSSNSSIVAIMCFDAERMKKAILNIKCNMHKQLNECKGWQLFQVLHEIPVCATSEISKQDILNFCLYDDFELCNNLTMGFNTVEEFEEAKKIIESIDR